jgi:hypothetical protein
MGTRKDGKKKRKKWVFNNGVGDGIISSYSSIGKIIRVFRMNLIS